MEFKYFVETSTFRSVMSCSVLHWNCGNAELCCHVLVRMIIARLEMNTMKINIKAVGSHFGIVRWYNGMAAAIRSLSRNVNQQGDIHCSPVPRRPTAVLTSLRRRMAISWYRALPKIHSSEVELWPSIYWIFCIGNWRCTRLYFCVMADDKQRARWPQLGLSRSAHIIHRKGDSHSSKIPYTGSLRNKFNTFLESLSQEFKF